MRIKLFGAVFVLGLTAVFANAQAEKSPAAASSSADRFITIENEARQKTKVGTVEIGKLKRHTVKVSDHGKEAVFEGVALVDVLILAGVEFGEKLRGKRMAEYLLVEAADDYRAVFALAELDPGFIDNVIIIADKRDGKALPENSGNWQIVVPNEKRAARWVRQVTVMKILTAPAVQK